MILGPTWDCLGDSLGDRPISDSTVKTCDVTLYTAVGQAICIDVRLQCFWIQRERWVPVLSTGAWISQYFSNYVLNMLPKIKKTVRMGVSRLSVSPDNCRPLTTDGHPALVPVPCANYVL